MKRFLFVISLFFFGFQNLLAQTCTISGHVTDSVNGETLIGATIYEPSSSKGTVTNAYGFFSLSLNKGEHEIRCTFIGYETRIFKLTFDSDIRFDIKLRESSLELGEVTVCAKQVEQVQKQNEFNAEVLTINSIKKLPAIFGESDIIKAIQMQSGVKTIGDASSGMLIRGGTNDQNLIIIDEAPIYNASHLFGMISIFNPDAVNQVTLYKSNMPAQYGGRISALIDCKMKEGNINKYDYSVSASPFAATITANGPIVKEKSAFLVSARRSFIDLFAKPSESTPLVPTFYDFNAKINTKIGSSDRLYASFYKGNDVIESQEGLFNTWGNTSGTLRWTHNFGSRWFLNTAFIISDYDNNLTFTHNKHQFKWHTGLSDINLKAALSYYIAPDCELRMGAGAIRHSFVPGETDSIEASLPHMQAIEYSAFILNDWKPFAWLGFNYGVYFSAFTPLDQSGKTFFYPEPRASINISLDENSSIKAAYARNVQYIQVLQNNALTYTSLETWFPATDNLKPLTANVFSSGYFIDISEKFSSSAELYYKKGQNQTDFTDHAQLINNPYVLSQVRSGESTAYGLELNLSKNTGKFTGSVSYTYSRVFYKIEGINGGDEYTALSDMPHDLRIAAHYQISGKWNASVTWQFSSGRPITLPVGFYTCLGQTVPIYSARNESRTPAYHRLDLSCGYTSAKNEKGFFWTAKFGIFNAYNHLNPIGYQFQTNYDTGEIKVYAYSMFGILPNISVRASW